MLPIIAIAAALVWALVCLWCYRIAKDMQAAQEDAISQAELDYLWRRMSEHGNADYVDTASLPHFKP
jgi:hypothetical protein